VGDAAAATPAGAGPTPPTAAAMKTATTTTTTTPGSTAAARRPTVPLAALTPYATSWTVRACVLKRGPKRTTPAGHPVFSAELVDAGGDAIDATFWREAADRWDPVLADGQWFYFSKAKVKPANKAFSSVRNPYALDFGVGSSVEPCPPEAGGGEGGGAGAPGSAPPPAPKLCYVRFDGLAPHIGRKAPVDVLGGVLEVGPLGSVKRKSDASELARRDLTLGDASGKSVVLTLWGEAAEGAGGAVEAAVAAAAAAGSATPPILSVSHCRVSDFNGVSISALGRSAVSLNPAGPAADALKAWWGAEAPGAGVAGFTPAGEGMAKAGGAGGAGPRPRARLGDLEAAPGEALPPPSAKPEYHTVVATITLVDPAQVSKREREKKGREKGEREEKPARACGWWWPPTHTPSFHSSPSPLTSLPSPLFPPLSSPHSLKDHVVRRRPRRPQPQGHPPRRRVVVRVRPDPPPGHDPPVRGPGAGGGRVGGGRAGLV
jgi:replication factor A1